MLLSAVANQLCITVIHKHEHGSLMNKNFILICFFSFASVLHASSMFDGFIDPEDGMFDASNWLAEQQGVLPLPILITEPAVGYGLGVALLFLHDPLAGTAPEGKTFDPQSKGTERLIPPSISAAFGMYTENGTWLAGGMHLGIWNDDHIRYLGAGGVGSININLYAFSATPDNPIKFNIELALLKQGVKFRLADSNFFAGIDYLLLATKSSFDDLLIKPGNNIALVSQDAAVTLSLNYDSRDTIFTPSRGFNASLEGSLYREVVGGDTDYEKYLAKLIYFTPIVDTVILGLRGQAEWADGIPIVDIPVYQYPFVDLRGIPKMRYQGKSIGVLEAEVRWDFNPRWSFIGFGGAGRYTSIISDVPAANVYTKGIGVRYLVSRRLRLRTGFDVAQGPEGTVFYIQMGQAW